MSDENPPQPISREDARRIWDLMKQNKPLSEQDQALLRQSAEWQMWAHHGIRLKPGNERSGTSSEISLRSPEKTAVS